MSLPFLIVAATLLLLVIIAVWIYFPFMVKKQFQLLLAETKRTNAALDEFSSSLKPLPRFPSTTESKPPFIVGPRES